MIKKLLMVLLKYYLMNNFSMKVNIKINILFKLIMKYEIEPTIFNEKNIFKINIYGKKIVSKLLLPKQTI